MEPEQVSGYLKRKMKIAVSHERIYQYIWADKRKGGDLYKHLRHGAKKHNKRGNKPAGRGLIPNRIGIEMRPSIVETKERIGDFEIDTIVGAHHKGAIVSLVERKTMVTRLGLIQRATADETSNTTIALLNPIKQHVHTLTADNGKEFTNHQVIGSKLDATVYFARPYHAWKRG